MTDATDSSSLPCGRTLDELSDYLARDRTPRDPSIESCPECVNALDGLQRLSGLSVQLIDQDGRDHGGRDEDWIQNVLVAIRSEVWSGRSIPVHHPDPRVTVTMTEGAVRTLIRSAGDEVPGVLMGRCALNGEVDVPGAPISVDVTASSAWGTPIPDLVDRLRDHLRATLAQHTELNIVAIDVTVRDVHISRDRNGERP